MSKKTIMLICSAGMSTSLLVTKMQKAAAEKSLELDIFAVAAQMQIINLPVKRLMSFY